MLPVKKKVYIAAVATDSMGIGAWTKPGRGEIPYAWQVMMNWSWMNPPALQFFYEDKTPNDYFIGGLSGPGYVRTQQMTLPTAVVVLQDSLLLPIESITRGCGLTGLMWPPRTVKRYGNWSLLLRRSIRPTRVTLKRLSI